MLFLKRQRIRRASLQEMHKTSEDLESARRRRAAMALLPGLIAFSMGQTVLFAVAGPVIREIGLSEIQLGMIVSAAALMFVIASPVWGGLSDRFGRKRVILFGLVTYSLVSFAFAGTMDLGVSGVLPAITVFVGLLLLRLVYAAFGSGIQPSSVALMADLSSDKERSSAVAIIGAAFGFGMILGPAAAALLVDFGVLVPLYVIAGLGLIGACNVLFFLDEPERVTDTARETDKLDLKLLLPVMLIALLLFSGISALQQTMAFYVQDFLGADAETAARMTGLCFVVMAVATLLVQGGLIQILKPSPNVLLRLGLPTLVVGITLYAFPVAFWQIVLASAVMGIGFGLANPGTIAAASLRVPETSQGAAAGMIQAMMAAGYVFGPISGTALYELDPLWTATLVAGVLAIAALISLGIGARPGPQPTLTQPNEP